MCLWLAKNRKKYVKRSGLKDTERFPAIFKNVLGVIQNGIFKVMFCR